MTQHPVLNIPPSFPPPPRKSNSNLILGVVAGIVVLLVVASIGIWILANAVDGGGNASGELSTTSSPSKRQTSTDDGAPATEIHIDAITMSPSASTDKGTTKCEYPETDVASQVPETKDVGTPGDGKKPDTGTQKMTIATNHGDLVTEVDNDHAPCTAASYDYLAGQKFFDNSPCHRLTTKDLFVLQCGDPSGSGRGGPSYHFDNEYVPKDTAADLNQEEQEAGKKPKPNYPAGTVAMANSGEGTDGKGTNGSQFFIVYKDTYLPADYTIFGELAEGLDIVKDIAEDGAVAP